MSQAGFGDSSAQKSINSQFPEPQFQSPIASSHAIGEPTTLFNALPRQVLEQELQFCNERSQQAQILLRQAQEQLQLSQLVIQRQETLTQTLQSRIDQLEREIQDGHTTFDELRDRLKRQQHHTSQLKAALERCLDTSTDAPKAIATSALESWSIAKLADEKISPVAAINDSPLQNVVKIVPAPQPIDFPETFPEVKELSSATQPPSETIDTPIQFSAKTQPISPLIVRPHRASQGSPIALTPIALDLPVASSTAPNAALSPELADLKATPPQAISSHDDNFNPTASNDSPLASGSVNNSVVIPMVAIPKFIQALYGNVNQNVNQEEPAQLAIANSTSSRKAVTSLAAVQLPQFPPLPRR